MHRSPTRVGSRTYNRLRRRRHHAVALGRNKRPRRDLQIPHRARRERKRNHAHPARNGSALGRAAGPTSHRTPAPPARRRRASLRCTGLQQPTRRRARVVLLVRIARALQGRRIPRRTRPQTPHGATLGRAPAGRGIDARAAQMRCGCGRGG